MAIDLPFRALVEGSLSNGTQLVMRVKARDRLRTPSDVLKVGEAAVRGEGGDGVSEIWAWVYGHDMPIRGPALAISYRETLSTEVTTEFMDPSVLAVIFAAGRPVPEA